MDKKHIITLVVVAVVFAAAGFFGGMQYQKSKTPAVALRGQGGQFAGRAGRGGANGGGFASGQIIAKDDKSITVKMASGSKIVFYSASTQISKPAPVQAADLATGQTVIISGQADSDGSIAAQTIQIRPENPTPQAQ